MWHKNLFYEKKFGKKGDIIAYSRNVNIKRESDLFAITGMTSDLVILGTKFLLLVQ